MEAEDQLVLEGMGATYNQVEEGGEVPGDVFMTENITNNPSDGGGWTKSLIAAGLTALGVGLPLAYAVYRDAPNPAVPEAPGFEDTDTRKNLTIVRD